MASNDCSQDEFWLPEEFLCYYFHDEGDQSGSILEPASSAAESEREEEEEDDFIVALTQQMGRYILQDVDDDMDAASATAAAAVASSSEEGKAQSQSPQSTLLPWPASSNASLDRRPSLPQPPQPDWRGKGSCLPRFAPRGRSRHLDPQSAPRQAPKARGSFVTPEWAAARAMASARRQSQAGAILDLSPSAWPPLGQPPPKASGMRAVSGRRNISVPHKESAGTGVFLPRVCGSCGGFILNGESCAASNVNCEVLNNKKCIKSVYLTCQVE